MGNVATIGKVKFDVGSIVIIVVTFVLFVVSVFLTGLKKELLLEIGVFLVSVKLIQQSYKITVKEEALQAKLTEMSALLERIESRVARAGTQS